MTRAGARGFIPTFCSTACKQRAYRLRRRTGLPNRLARVDRWVRADGKRPIQCDGRSASSTDPATWASLDLVARSRAGDGFGVMLGGGLACWDLDHCLSGGELAPWAADVLAGIRFPIWAERSSSGDGLHVFVEAAEGPGTRQAGVEFYSRARFIRVTGEKFEGMPR